MRYTVILMVIVLAVIVGSAGISSYRDHQVQIQAAEQRVDEHRQAMLKKHNEISQRLEQVRSKPNKSDHDKWLIQHLEKTQKHLEPFIKPQPEKRFSGVDLTLLETGSMVLLMLLGFGHMAYKNYQTRQAYPAQPGFHQPRFRAVPQNDPVANNTHWQYMRGGGANFQTHTLMDKGNNRLVLKASSQMQIFYGLFIVIGLNNMVFTAIKYIQKQGLENALADPFALMGQFLSVGFMFVLSGLFVRFLFAPSDSVFDGNDRVCYLNKAKVSFSEVHALQILEELAGGHDSGVFRSYELNLVLKSGERHHLMDHGNYQAFNGDAECLAEFLAVPIWEA